MENTDKYRQLKDVIKAISVKVDISDPDKYYNIFLTNIYYSYADVEKIPGPPETSRKAKDSMISYLKKLAEFFDFTPWVLLMILGILSAITGIIADYFYVYAYNLRISLANEIENPIVSFLAYWAAGFVMITIAASVGIYFSPFCDGSGVPELKSILSGANTFNSLSPNIFFPKLFGMIMGYGSGLAVGKIGPMIHLCAIIANFFIKFDIFNHLKRNYAQRRSIYSAAVGCGVTAAFGAPIAGIIFSIELVYGNFNVMALFRTFYATIWTSLTYKTLGYFISIDPLIKTKFTAYQLNFDIFSFVFLGLLIGLVTVAVLKVSVRFIFLRRTLKWKVLERYPFVWLTYTLITLLTFPFPYSRQSMRLFLNDSFSVGELHQIDNLGVNPYLNMVLCVILYWINIAFTFACNIPFGIFGPPCILGAIAGRCFAELGEFFGLFNPAFKGAYGVAGAAACISVVTRSIAPIIMLIESTG
jgi:chloride channel 2